MGGQETPLTVVAFGDSITKGAGHFGVTDDTAFPGLLRSDLSRWLGREAVVHNAGVGGDIAPQALERVERDVLARQPSIVTVMFGVNDAGYYRPDTDGFADTPRVSTGEFRQALGKTVRRIQMIRAEVVLLTPLPMNEHYWGADLKPYVENGLNYLVAANAQSVREVARETMSPLVDTYVHFDSYPEAIDFVPDGIHPNREGHRIIADLLIPVLRDLIQRAGCA